MNPSAAKAIRLHAIAHARAGDKGNHSNISLFAYRAADYDLLVRQVTEERVGAWFATRHPSAVKRYLLPRLFGLNFVLQDVLDGGVNDSLNLDSHGKALSYHLLMLEIEVAPAFTLPPLEGPLAP